MRFTPENMGCVVVRLKDTSCVSFTSENMGGCGCKLKRYRVCVLDLKILGSYKFKKISRVWTVYLKYMSGLPSTLAPSLSTLFSFPLPHSAPYHSPITTQCSHPNLPLSHYHTRHPGKVEWRVLIWAKLRWRVGIWIIFTLRDDCGWCLIVWNIWVIPRWVRVIGWGCRVTVGDIQLLLAHRWCLQSVNHIEDDWCLNS